MNPNKTLKTMDDCIQRGWLSRLDRAFAAFMLDQDGAAGEAVLWAGALLSHQLGRGEVFLDLERLFANPGATLAIPDNDARQKGDDKADSIDFLQTHNLRDWLAELSDSPLVASGAGNTPLVLQGKCLYLRRYWQYQQTLEHEIGLRLQARREALPQSLQSSLAQLFDAGAEQPDWQKIACVLALRARFSIITGGPGTGKTTTLIKLLSLLIQLSATEQARKLNILLAAPTGKAAARVSESIANALARLPVADAIKAQIPQHAATLHRLLGSRPDSRRFRHHRHNPLLADVVIVDEASMIDLEMMAALLEALPANTQLILLGDKDQLASVEAGSVMGDLCAGAEHSAFDAETRCWIRQYADVELAETSTGSNLNQQTVMLRRSHRFGADSGIGHLARVVNAGDAGQAPAILSQNPAYTDLTRLLLTTVADLRLQQLITNAADDKLAGYGHFLQIVQRGPQIDDEEAWARAVLQAFDRFRVLCALRRGDWSVESMNQRIEQWLFADNKLGAWYPGRPVMVTRNDYTLGLMNGDIGIALTNSSGKLRVVFPGEANSLRWISPLRLPAVETAFAMTVHKAQGSEFEHVALLLPEAGYPVLSKELIYTGITRAKRHFSLLESKAGVLEQAIRTRCR